MTRRPPLVPWLALVMGCAGPPSTTQPGTGGQPPSPSESSAPPSMSAPVVRADATRFEATRPRAGQTRREDLEVRMTRDWSRQPVARTWGGRREVTLLDVDGRGNVREARVRYGRFIDRRDEEEGAESPWLSERSFLVRRVDLAGCDSCFGGRHIEVLDEGANGDDQRPTHRALREAASHLFQEHDQGFPATIIGRRLTGWSDRWGLEADAVQAVELTPGTRLMLPPGALDPVLSAHLLGRSYAPHTATLTFRGVGEAAGARVGVFDLDLEFCDIADGTGVKFEGEVRGEVLVHPVGARPLAITTRGVVRTCDGRELAAWEARQTFSYEDPAE